jgi:hypothetical protein
VIADVVERQNVGVVQRGHRLGFLFEAPQPIAIAGKRFWQNLQGHFAAQARISGAIHLAHAARAYQRLDFIRTDLGALG